MMIALVLLIDYQSMWESMKLIYPAGSIAGAVLQAQFYKTIMLAHA